MIMKMLRRWAENWKAHQQERERDKDPSWQYWSGIIRARNQAVRDKHMQALTYDLVELMKSSGAVKSR